MVSEQQGGVLRCTRPAESALALAALNELHPIFWSCSSYRVGCLLQRVLAAFTVTCVFCGELERFPCFHVQYLNNRGELVRLRDWLSSRPRARVGHGALRARACTPQFPLLFLSHDFFYFLFFSFKSSPKDICFPFNPSADGTQTDVPALSLASQGPFAF